MGQEEYREMNSLTPKGRRINVIMDISHRILERLETMAEPLPPLQVVRGSEDMEEKPGCQSCEGGFAQLVDNARCFDCGVGLTICWFCIGLGEHLQICHCCTVKRTKRWYGSPHSAEWLLNVIIREKGRRLSKKERKDALYEIQEGKCVGCHQFFPLRNMTVDHVEPTSKGGRDDIDNLQLLCGACNSKKGARSQEEFIARLSMEGRLSRR